MVRRQIIMLIITWNRKLSYLQRSSYIKLLLFPPVLKIDFSHGNAESGDMFSLLP